MASQNLTRRIAICSVGDGLEKKRINNSKNILCNIYHHLIVCVSSTHTYEHLDCQTYTYPQNIGKTKMQLLIPLFTLIFILN